MKFAVYDRLNGEMVRRGSCPEEDVLSQAGPNEVALPYEQDNTTLYTSQYFEEL